MEKKITVFNDGNMFIYDVDNSNGINISEMFSEVTDNYNLFIDSGLGSIVYRDYADYSLSFVIGIDGIDVSVYNKTTNYKSNRLFEYDDLFQFMDDYFKFVVDILRS